MILYEVNVSCKFTSCKQKVEDDLTKASPAASVSLGLTLGSVKATGGACV